MANIKVTVDYEITDGATLTFKTPCDCTAVTGLKVYYPVITDTENTTSSKTFAFKDAHNNNLSSTGNLFVEGATIKVILDVTNGNAYIQNQDTNAYLEGKFSGIESDISALNAELSNTDSNISTIIDSISAINTKIGTLYYKPNDTMTINNMICAGYLTHDSQNLHFSIPSSKPLVGVSNVEITNPTEAIISARKVAGGYIISEENLNKVGTTYCLPYEYGVKVRIAAPNTYNATNNTPVAVAIDNFILKFT